ncbi:MAG: hypothetical protein GY913_12585 [Proteobacteria bacterium]|nr:hypothetical protein [Pseudomonadota bacterium]MCP4917742.1 hypothetical protein [Pseudomonadota bacterium]
MAKKKNRWDKAVVEALVAGNGDEAVLAWLAGTGALETSDVTLGLSAVEAAVQTGAVAPLQSIGAVHKDVTKAAKKGLHRLKSKGIEVADAPRAKSSFTLASDTSSIPPVAMFGPPTVEGYSEFVLSCTDDEGTCVLMGAFGGKEGIRNLTHGHVSRKQLRDLRKEIGQQSAMVELPFTEAMSHLLPSIDRVQALTGKLPHDWDHFVTHVPAGTLDAARTHDALSGVEPSPDMEGTSALSMHPWFQLWPVASDAIEEVVTKLSTKMEEDSGDDGEETPSMHADLAAASAKALDGDGIRDEWVRRARLATSVAKAAGDDTLASTAAAIANHVGSGGDAGDIPFVERTLQVQIGWMAQQAMESGPPPTP